MELVVSQILSDLSDPPPTREGTGPRRRFSAWELVLLILGSPLWLSLAVVAGLAVLTPYAVLWSVLLSLVGAGPCLGSLRYRWGFVPHRLRPSGQHLAGDRPVWRRARLRRACLLFFFACKRASKGTLSLAKRLFTGLKSRLIRKERRA